MRAIAGFGTIESVTLADAILLYRGNGRAFATRHRVLAADDRGAPVLGAGEPLTIRFVRALTRALGTSLVVEVFPESVLARTPDTIAWWTAAQHRPMFFAAAERGDRSSVNHDMSGRTFPHPALVWKLTAEALYVRALPVDARPTATTALATAPYWNTDATGFVCPGSMRLPGARTVDALPEWEQAYFGSAFTHPSGVVRLTTHPGGWIGLWTELVGSHDPFPARYLSDAHQTLRAFVEA